MGNLQVKPLFPATQAAAFEMTEAGTAAWLDALLAMPASEAVAPWHEEANRQRLRTTPFNAILSAIDRAQPGFGRACEMALYQNWIAVNDRATPLLYAAWFNLGVLFTQECNAANAVVAYQSALALQPTLHAAAVALGLLLEAEGQPDQALAVWQTALQPDQARIDLQTQQGRLLETLDRFNEAEKALRRVLMTDPAQPDVVHHWMHIRQKICQWPVTCSDIPGLSAEAQTLGTGPLGILALTDDIEQQRAAAGAWVARKTKPAPRRLAPVNPYPHTRIRLGYMSSDFCSHAMSYLITELFERHDRSRFEVFGYCASQDDGTPLRKRVLGAFDHYRIIRGLSDERAAQIIRDDEIDVLIDLNGITDGSRLTVLRWRPAPIQATYLGFIGPIPLPELDYLLCDNVVIPPEHEAAYQPKPLSVARIYQANDSKRIMGRQLSRTEAGLPDQSFVFCCFSKHYKITEEVFSAWMAILRQTDRAVLWLTTDNAFSQANMMDAAKRAGIAEERIIFCERAELDLYMSRLGLADLFLDTFPYNAGTVASDAIRMRLPLVTLCGKAFASRMAASLLHAIEASEGITTSLAQYIRTAVRLATDPAAYARYKALFTHEAWSQTIGNIDLFTSEFEDVLCRLVQSRRNDTQRSIQAAKDPVTHYRSSQIGTHQVTRLSIPAVSPSPIQFDLQHNLDEAINHHQAGRMAEAERLYRSILALQPSHAVASYSFGMLCFMQGRLQEAIKAYQQAIASQPNFVNAYVNLGTVVLSLGQREEAASLYRQAIAIDPGNAMAYGNLGKALQDLGQIDEAIIAYRAGMERQSDNANIHLNLGAALLEQKAWDAAMTVSQRAIALDPHNPMAHANLGTALLNLGHYQDALASCRRAITLQPQSAIVCASLGGAMIGLGALEEGITLCRQAVGLDAILPAGHFNLSHALKATNQLAEAAFAARQAIALCPNSAEYHFHLAHILLLQGDLEAGWLEYEWRMKLPDFAWTRDLFGDPSKSLWTGEDISGKTILIYTEQGFGDIIQFARYLPMVVRRAGRVIVAINSPVGRLLEMIKGITIVSAKEKPLPVFDVQCPLMSLPLAFGTRLDSIPANVPYLHIDQAERKRWDRKEEFGGLRVGIVWAGNPVTKGDRFRSPGLASMTRLFSVPRVSFVVLQVGPGREDCDTCRWPPNVVDLGKEVADLADTAAIMAGLDLVISSCTAPLHLAGALGMPSWAMIPFAPHFPWLLDRTDTAWYPSMRLYRQKQPGQDWSDVVDRIAIDLAGLTKYKLVNMKM